MQGTKLILSKVIYLDIPKGRHESNNCNKNFTFLCIGKLFLARVLSGLHFLNTCFFCNTMYNERLIELQQVAGDVFAGFFSAECNIASLTESLELSDDLLLTLNPLLATSFTLLGFYSTLQFHGWGSMSFK